MVVLIVLCFGVKIFVLFASYVLYVLIMIFVYLYLFIFLVKFR